MSLALPPYHVYTDTDGQPLENGYLYFGVANQNPQTAPVAIFWDVDLTIPAANPVRTLNGYASNNGSPGNIFTSGDFSITVRRSDGAFVYSRLSNQESAASTAGLSYWLTNVIGTDAITADAAVSLPAYQDGLVVRLQSAGANTGAVTINVSGVGVVDVTKNGLDPLVAGDIPSGSAVELTYTGAGFQLTSITPNEYPTQARDSNNLKIANTAYADRAGRDKIPQVTASVAASALTITLDPCQIDFRNATGSSGLVSTRVLSAPISITVSSGSTLGTENALKSRLAVLAIDNSGTVELAVCNWFGPNTLDETAVISTTAEGGVGGADSKGVIYSASARANVAYRLIGLVESTQATAGTWVTTPSFVQGITRAISARVQSLAEAGDKVIADIKYSAAAIVGTIYTETFNSRIHNDGIYRVKFELRADGIGDSATAKIYKNGAAYGTERSTSSGTFVPFSEDLSFEAGDTIQIFAFQGGTGTKEIQKVSMSVSEIRGINPPIVIEVGAR